MKIVLVIISVVISGVILIYRFIEKTPNISKDDPVQSSVNKPDIRRTTTDESQRFLAQIVSPTRTNQKKSIAVRYPGKPDNPLDRLPTYNETLPRKRTDQGQLPPLSGNGNPADTEIRQKISLDGKDWDIALDLRAVRSETFSNDKEPVAWKIGHFVISKTTPSEQQNAQVGLVSNSINPPVVVSVSTGRPGIVTGVFSVKYSSGTNLEQLASDFQLRVKSEFVHIRTGFLTSGDGEDLLTLLKIMKKDSRIERVQLEILGDPDVPN